MNLKQTLNFYLEAHSKHVKTGNASFIGLKMPKMQSKPKKHSKQSLFMESTPKLGLYRWGTVSLSIHKYKYTNTNTQIQMHKYKFTNTHKCGCEKGRSEALEHRKLIKVGLSKMYLRSVQHKLKEVWALKEFLKYWICIMEVFTLSSCITSPLTCGNPNRLLQIICHS